MKEISGIEIDNEGGSLSEKLIGLVITLAIWGISLIVMHKMRTKERKD